MRIIFLFFFLFPIKILSQDLPIFTPVEVRLLDFNDQKEKQKRLHILLRKEDSRTDQVFDLGILGRRLDGMDLILRFEIMEVYHGKKYKDTAITKIYFDGIDVH